VENENAFKNLINAKVVQKYLSVHCKDKKAINKVILQLNDLELRARVQLIANELKNYLDADFTKAIKQLVQITRSQKMRSFELWPATEFIQLYGLDHIEESFEVMQELTPKFTAEFCVRPFINKHGVVIYKKLHKLKSHPDEHIRRWVSEGTRPRLPWGEKLKNAVLDPSHGLDLLESLKFDSSLYVRKSVANHLNDISKDHPQKVVQTLKRWAQEVPKNYENEFRFIVHRALRTLIKNGDPQALSLVGVKSQDKVLSCSEPKIKNKKIKIGESVEFSFSIKNKSSKKIKYLIDFVIYYKKSNGDLSPKVFKLKSGYIEGHETLNMTKKVSFRPITTRTYHLGEHRLALKVNGTEKLAVSFVLGH
jgi:3-methyladenine DNA glycosylase AlkC